MSVRFAPSPTGRFHVGNLRTAWISERLARLAGLPWVVRFEDIDTLRVVAGARETQLADLAALGLVPDEIVIQSARHARHLALLRQAAATGQVYPCACSRKDVLDALEASASAPHGPSPVYHGHCRPAAPGGPAVAPPRASPEPGKLPILTGARPSFAWRFRSADPSGARDFIVARTAADAALARSSSLAPESTAESELDFMPAYPWACAIDDLDGGYQLLVRASDLARVLWQQRDIQAWMLAAGQAKASAARPAVFHCSIVTTDSGARLEKRTRGVTLPELGERGYPPERLAQLFAASFAPPVLAELLGSEAVGGEVSEQITLASLKLAPFSGDD
jgi:glutamyl-tRNA synthetase